MADFELLIN